MGDPENTRHWLSLGRVSPLNQDASWGADAGILPTLGTWGQGSFLMSDSWPQSWSTTGWMCVCVYIYIKVDVGVEADVQV